MTDPIKAADDSSCSRLTVTSASSVPGIRAQLAITRLEPCANCETTSPLSNVSMVGTRRHGLIDPAMVQLGVDPVCSVLTQSTGALPPGR